MKVETHWIGDERYTDAIEYEADLLDDGISLNYNGNIDFFSYESIFDMIPKKDLLKYVEKDFIKHSVIKSLEKCPMQLCLKDTYKAIIPIIAYWEISNDTNIGLYKNHYSEFLCIAKGNISYAIQLNAEEFRLLNELDLKNGSQLVELIDLTKTSRDTFINYTNTDCVGLFNFKARDEFRDKCIVGFMELLNGLDMIGDKMTYNRSIVFDYIDGKLN